MLSRWISTAALLAAGAAVRHEADDTCGVAAASPATQGCVLLQRDQAVGQVSLSTQVAEGDEAHRCCTSFQDAGDRCGTCWPGAWAAADGWCSASEENCLQGCSGAWCGGSDVAAPTPQATATSAPDQVATPAPVTGEEARRCCTSSQDAADRCGTCWPDAWAAADAWCSASEENCLQGCSGAWCAGGDAAAPTGTAAPGATPTPTSQPVTAAPTASPRAVPVPQPVTAAPTASPTAAPVPTPVVPPASNQSWVSGTWTTGYWDCCKPSCSWPNKGSVNQPTLACDARTGEKLTDSNVASVCDGGSAASCADNRPFVVKPRLSMGFSAIAVSGSHGLLGDTNCGQCFELRFADRRHQDGNWGGAHAELVGRSMVVQVTNIGYDVNGDHSFDLQIPGAGQGIFTNGCTAQFAGHSSGDFDCDNNYGGCFEKSGCERLPEALRAGCEWRYDWYHWFEAGGQTNNPFVDFRRVRCPEHLTNISGSLPDDDEGQPEIDLSSYEA